MVISRTRQVQPPSVTAPSERRLGTRALLPSIAFVVASVVSGALNLGYQRLFGADIDDDALGALRAVLAALAGFGFFVTGLQVAFATMVQARGAVATSAVRLRRASLGIAGAAAAAALATGLLWLPSGSSRSAVAPLIALYVFVAALSALPRARLLVHRRWAELAAVIVVAAVFKVAGAMIARVAGASLVAALVALVVAEIVALVIAQVLARLTTRSLPSESVGGTDQRSLAVSIASLVGLWALTGLDSVIARVSMSAEAADAYSASSSIARLAFFAPAIVAWLSLPDFIERGYGHAALRRSLTRSLIAVGGISLVTAVLVMVIPSQLHDVVASRVDVLSVPSARWLAASWALFSVASLLVFFHVAQRSRLGLLPWGGALIVAIGGVMVGDNPAGLARMVMLGALVTVVALLIPALTRVQPVTHSIQALARPHHDAALAIRDVAIIVPCYNPGEVVVDTLRRIAATLSACAESFEVIAVSDGSTDGSPDLIDAIDADWLRHVRCEQNGGKGKALRIGFAAARAGVIGFIDADGDLPPEQLPRYLEAVVSYDADAVLGSKRHPESHLEVPFHRVVYSWGYQRLVRALFRLDIRDTQTGIKLFRRELIEEALPLLEEDGFALDLELFVVARAFGFLKFVEMPVRLEHQFNSTISNRSAATMLMSTLRIFWRSRFSLTYVRKVDALESQRADVESVQP